MRTGTYMQMHTACREGGDLPAYLMACGSGAEFYCTGVIPYTLSVLYRVPCATDLYTRAQRTEDGVLRAAT